MAKERASIAEVLEIDLKDQEARTHSVQDLLHLRVGSSKYDIVFSIDLVLDDIALALVRFETAKRLQKTRRSESGQRPTSPSPARRGRPKGIYNEPAFRLVNELITLFEHHAEKSASRSVIVSGSTDLGVPNNVEAGDFTGFFSRAVAALPRQVRSQVARNGGGYAALIRSALETRRAFRT